MTVLLFVASTCRRSVQFWLLHNFSLDGELCLRDGKNGAFVLSSPSFVVVGQHRKRLARRAHMPQAVYDWLNPHSLGTMSAFNYIENLAENSNL